jgi:predicted CoA-binding protein
MELTMLEEAIDVLRTHHSFAVIGVSREPEKYGHEVFEVLRSGGYHVYPINPKYAEIDGHPCYPALDALPDRPEVVVVALAPQVTEKLMPGVIAAGIPVIWLPPGCYTPAAVEACRTAGVHELHDVCPVMAVGTLQAGLVAARAGTD